MKRACGVVGCLIIFAAGTAAAETVQKPWGDPKAGEAKAELCLECHGPGGHSTDPTFPKLAGQFRNYIYKQIKDFQSGVRQNETMNDMASMIESEEDLMDIIEYFASQPQMAGQPTVPPRMVEFKDRDGKVIMRSEAEVGKELFRDVNIKCFECHGDDGRGWRQRFGVSPMVAGQHKQYLLKAMDDIHTDKRQADQFRLMWRSVNFLTMEQREYIAEWLSGLKPGEERTPKNQ